MTALSLTPRQRAVVQGISDGLTCAQIAAELKITEAGVRKHVEAIAKRLTGKGGPVRRIVANTDKLLGA